MKNKFNVFKFIFLVEIIAIFTFAMCFFIAADEANTADLNIDYCNLAFDSDTHIMYAVKSDNASVKLLVWSSPQDEYLLNSQNEIVSPYTEQMIIEGEPYTVFKYMGLSAKQMTDNVYVRACIDNGGGDVIYGNVHKYSILQYAYNKLGKTGVATADDKLINALNKMLEYGAAIQELKSYKTDTLATDEFVEVKLADGALPDGFKSGLYKVGTTVTISAPMQNSEGRVFAQWIDKYQKTVAGAIEHVLTVGAVNNIYTPKYYSQGLEFTSNGDGTCYVSGIGDCEENDISVPPFSPNGDKVVGIGDEAFESCTALIKITIPNSVTSIGESAFSKCTNLESIDIPEDVRSIAWGAFDRCYSLMNIKLPSGISFIDGSTFYNCISLTSIEIPTNVVNIGARAFQGCFKLAEIYNLSSLDITVGTENLGYVGFYALNVYTPTQGCSKIDVVDKYIFYADENVTYLMGYMGDNTELVLPLDYKECAYEIYAHAFSSRKSLAITSVIVPDNVNSIGENAFASCTDLENVVIGNGVKNIGGGAFSSCIKLKKLTLGCNVENIGWSAFSGCSSLESIVLPQSIKTIEGYAFSYCDKLTIYAEAASQQEGWDSRWNYSHRPVHWGYGGNA